MSRRNRKKRNKARKAALQAVSSEKMEPAEEFSEIDYPPEVVDFINEALKKAQKELGLKPGEQFQEEALREFFRTYTQSDEAKELAKVLGVSGIDIMVFGDSTPYKSGYNPELNEYWYNGTIYHEKDVIWCQIVDIEELEDSTKMLGVSANFDLLKKRSDLFTSIDISSVKDVKVENYRRVLSKEERFDAFYYGKNVEFLETLTPPEEVWWLATEHAKTENTPGYVIVCLNGKFYIPIEGFIDFHNHVIEELISFFNVATCLPGHRNCVGTVIAEVGNMQFYTAVCYMNGGHLDWHKRFEQELEAYMNVNPDYDPFSDPYDSSNDDDPFGFGPFN